jgi:hypothetical protein
LNAPIACTVRIAHASRVEGMAERRSETSPGSIAGDADRGIDFQVRTATAAAQMRATLPDDPSRTVE